MLRTAQVISLGFLIAVGAAYFTYSYDSRNSLATASLKTSTLLASKCEDTILTAGILENKTPLLPLLTLKQDGFALYKYPRQALEDFDPGYRKWLLVFEEYQGEALPSYEMKRFLEIPGADKDGFVLSEPLETTLKPRFEGSSENEPPIQKNGAHVEEPLDVLTFTKDCPGMMISERGFLPGERITIRTKSKEKAGYREVSFCPHPLILGDKSGKQLATAELAILTPTYYRLHIDFDKTNRLRSVVSTSLHERIENQIEQTQSIDVMFCPAVLGAPGGSAVLQFTYEDGNCYELKLPWGLELIAHAKGEK
ncbi:MAG: hypothetical protein JSR76_06505 [Verrucomicrobia bacterium]|nr:hypothetical protein [Verrucomicrobiota bacterium]